MQLEKKLVEEMEEKEEEKVNIEE